MVEGDAPIAPIARIAISATGVVLALGSFWLASCGVAVTDRGIRIRNPTRIERIEWGRIESFAIGRWTLFPRIGIVFLTDGGRRHIWGIQGPNPLTRPKNRSAERLIDELNQIRAQVAQERRDA